MASRAQRRAPARRVATLGVALLAAPSAAAAQPADDGGVIVLPVQDRAGNPMALSVVELLLTRRVAEGGAEPWSVRSGLRKRRLRDPGRLPPEALDSLANELGARAFLAVTIHEAREEPVPHATVSGQLVVAGEPWLRWAGFESGTGADGETLLGLGRETALEPVVRKVTERLIDDLRTLGTDRPALPDPTDDVFVGPPVTLTAPPGVAVLPFGASLAAGGAAAADLATDLATAALFRRGALVVAPGVVRDRLVRAGRIASGEADQEIRRALVGDGPTGGVLTGQVEQYRFARTGPHPEPQVALAARLLHTADGRIVWMGGLERRGWDAGWPFELGRTFGPAPLAEEMMEALLQSIEEPDRGVAGVDR